MPNSKYAPRAFAGRYRKNDVSVWAFPKFKKAHYGINLDLDVISNGDKDRGIAAVTATIEFESFVLARPAIEFIGAPLAKNIRITLDNIAAVDHTTVVPVRAKKENLFFGIDKELKEDNHTLVIKYEMPLLIADAANPSFMLDSDPGVYWHFRMSDGRPNRQSGIDGDCGFLGRYLPTNLEFDAHPKSISLEFGKIDGQDKSLRLFTNGNVEGADLGPVTLVPGKPHTIVYPDDFRSSSVFFYLADPVLIDEISFPLAGHGTGQTVTIFGPKKDKDGFKSTPSTYKASVEIAAAAIMADFDRSFPYDHIFLYSGRQGMEYAGAAEISGGNVLHELFHLFIGRWLVPVDGPSGWWDEAIAHWYVSGKNSYAHPPDTQSSIGKGPRYRRWTSKKARSTGAMFIGYLDHLLRKPDDQLTMISFVKDLASASQITPLNTKEFRKKMEKYSGKSFKKHFRHYVGRK